MTNTENIRVFTITDPMDVKRIIKGYYKELYAHEFNNFNKTNQLSENILPKFIQREIGHLNRFTSVKVTEAVI